jgi:hypothetical protein
MRLCRDIIETQNKSSALPNSKIIKSIFVIGDLLCTEAYGTIEEIRDGLIEIAQGRETCHKGSWYEFLDETPDYPITELASKMIRELLPVSECYFYKTNPSPYFISKNDYGEAFVDKVYGNEYTEHSFYGVCVPWINN